MLHEIRHDIDKLANPDKAKFLLRFFKTGKGEYAEGDVFLGITVPEQRVIARKYSDLPIKDVEQLLESKYHEYRLIALLIIVNRFPKSDPRVQKELVTLYLDHTKNINNWDLVDLSAPKILGAYLWEKDRRILYKLAKSKNLWERRISILSTLYFIQKGQFEDTLEISKLLFNDTHDLIHKALGWMLREVGKKDFETEYQFLLKYFSELPRTSLRYAIERFPEKLRQEMLKKKLSPKTK
jgi:3-methyladenine DNA glycosylase AlkD